MYEYVKDKEFLTRAYGYCADIVNQLVQELKKYDIHARMNVVGSMKRNMVTQNAKQAIDFDFNLLIENPGNYYRERDLKEAIRKAFNEILARNGWGDCSDSKSVLTTEQRVFKTGNKTPFSIDVCIVKRDQYGLHRLVHRKTGWTSMDEWYWNLVPNTQNLHEREAALKPDYWLEVREAYLDKKNMYLSRQQEGDHPSFNCYIEAVNEVYDKRIRGTAWL